MTLIFCQIRKEWVADLPEERVRQKLLNHMVTKGRFPKELLVVEKNLKDFSLKFQLCPKKRVDILCFYKKEAQLLPFLLVECKAKKLTKSAERQLIGYNYYLKAPFIVLANDLETRLGYYHLQEKEWVFQSKELFYPQLRALFE